MNGFDAIVVGSGATGSWATKLLSENGLTVLVLDCGNIPDNTDIAGYDLPLVQREPGDERQLTQSQCCAFSPSTRHLFVDDIEQPYDTPVDKPFTWIRTRVIGGRTALWFGTALRMSDRQFSAASLDGFGVNWPIRYEDLRPHYELAERFLRVTGIEEKLEEIPDGIFLPVTLPAVARVFQQAVHKHWPDRVVTALRRARIAELTPLDASERERNARLSACSGGAALCAADSTGRMTVRSNARVLQVMTNDAGSRAEGVVYIDGLTGKEVEVHGKVVILCASTIETTRIMLSSATRAHPNGLGNSHGILGQYLMDHTSGVGVVGYRLGSCQNNSELYIPNFRNRAGSKSQFIRGYGIQGSIRPFNDQTIECALGCFGEVLPRAENQVRLGNRNDKWGVPVPQVTYAYSDNEFEMANDQATELARIVECSGFDIGHRQGLGVPGGSIHEVGGARMGLDPKTSVLNSHNQCWRVHNLFVTDGAAFPTAGFQNPTLTMMALTGRACDYILQEFKRESTRPFISK